MIPSIVCSSDSLNRTCPDKNFTAKLRLMILKMLEMAVLIESPPEFYTSPPHPHAIEEVMPGAVD